MEEMMRHPLDEKIKNDPDFLNSLPTEYRLMYLLSKEMRFNNTIDAVNQVSEKKNLSEDEKQNMIDEAVKLKDLNNWSDDEKQNNWHCEVCDKDYKKRSKNRHLNSKLHKNKEKNKYI